MLRLKKTLLLALAIAFSTPSNAASYDTLIFGSGFEQSVLTTLTQKNLLDPLKALTAFDSDSAAYEATRAKLEQFYAQVGRNVANAKGEKAKTKIVFREVHDMFLRKYEEHTSFHSIFTSGNYNCVTASALFAIVLEKFAIPYQIKETPTHVYLVAYPGSGNILFETTTPQGFVAHDEKTKENYVKSLVATKYITEEYVKSVGVSRAFNDFFYNNDEITLRDLLSLQYYNECIRLTTDEKYAEAMNAIKKARLFKVSPKYEFMEQQLLGQVLSNSDFSEKQDIVYLVEFANLARDERSKKSVLKFFEFFTEKYLFQQSKESQVQQGYDVLARRVQDAELMKNISEIFYYQLARWHYIKGRKERAFEIAKLGHENNPENAEMQQLIVEGIRSKLIGMIGSSESIALLDEYVSQYSFLKNNPVFQTFYIIQYCILSYQSFQEDDGPKGYRYMKLLEERIAQAGVELNEVRLQIGMVYAEAGAHHYRLHQLATARQILTKGLAYSPGHAEIKARLEIVEKEMR